MTQTAARRRILVALVVVAVGALAAYLRVTMTYATSWAGPQLVPYDTDPYYQLRRLELWHAGLFPPGVDDWFVNAPSRFDCPWPLGLPLVLDVFVRVATLGHAATRHELEAIAAFAIPLLGALTPIALVLLLWRRHGAGVAWLAGVASAALPSSRMAAHYGRIDHHVLEPTAALALYALVVRAPSPHRWRTLALASAFGLAAALTLDLTYVYCVVLAALAVGFALLRRPLEADREAAVAVAAGMVAATLIELAVGAPRALAPDLRVAIAVAFALALAAPRTRARWPWAALALVGAYGLVRGLALGRWLAAPADSVTRTMDEALPGWSRATAAQLLFHSFPVVVAALALTRRRHRDLPLLGFLGGLLLLNVAQAKYQAMRGLTEAIGWALLPSLIAPALPETATLLRRLLRPAVAVFVVAMSLRLMPPNPALPQIAIARDLARVAASVPGAADGAWLTRRPPSTTVLAHPVDAVRFAYLARVAGTALPFWGQPTSLRQYEETLALLSGPYSPELERRLDAWRIKYVLVTNPRPQLGLYEQLRVGLGAEYPGWPATATLRLVVEAGTARLFERVRGAVVRGRAGPNETVTLVARVAVGGRLVPFRATTRADGDGSFRLGWPYATVRHWPVEVAAVELRCGARTRDLAISDAAVETGGEVSADCAPPATRP